MVVGVPDANGGQGLAYVYTRGANGWQSANQPAVLAASNGAAGDEFGYSVAVSAGRLGDRRRRALRGRRRQRRWPGLRVQPPGRWLGAADHAEPDHQRVRPSDDDRFGHGVALSPDGTYLAAGASGYSSSQSLTGQGGVYVWSYSGSALTPAGSGAIDGQRCRQRGRARLVGGDAERRPDLRRRSLPPRERRTRGGVRVLLGDQLRDRLRALGARLADRVERQRQQPVRLLGGRRRRRRRRRRAGDCLEPGRRVPIRAGVRVRDSADPRVLQGHELHHAERHSDRPLGEWSARPRRGADRRRRRLCSQARLVGRCRRTRPPAPRTCSRRRVAAGPTPRSRPRR